MAKFIQKSTICLLALVMVATIALPLSASAGDLTRTYDGQFTTEWEYTVTSGNASLTYGYNTTAINEDYAWANNSNASHFASLTNGTGVHNGGTKNAGTVSKIEVRHNGSSVEYHCYW
jgi:hypothetical protein